MKKYLLAGFILGISFVCLPSGARAQYTDPYYNSRMIGDMITRKTMENAAARKAGAKKAVPGRKKSKSARPKKPPRASLLNELQFTPKILRTAPQRSKAIEIG